MNKLFYQFSKICKYFTVAMILKHRLQEHLFFNGASLELNSDEAKELTTILTSLQSLANIFNDMEFTENNSRCVKLTPAQYRIMYYVRYTAPLLESLKDDLQGWYRDDSLYEYPEVRHC